MANIEINDLTKFFGRKIKSFLASRDKNIIGLDIGLSSIKLMQLKQKGEGFIVEHYAESDLPEGVIIEDEVHDEDTLVNILIDTYKRGKFSTKNICFGLWGNNSIVRKIQIPVPDEDDDLYDHVLWEAEQYIPFEIDDAYLSYHEIGVNEGGGLDLILAAVKKKTLDAFREIINSAGLHLRIVDHGAISFVNCFSKILKIDNGNKSIILCEIGAQKSFFYVLKNNQFNFYKEIQIGGQMITEEIQRQMGVTYEEADDLKINGDGTGNIPEEVNIIIEEVLAIFINDISELIDFYKQSSSDEDIDCFYMAGKTTGLSGFLNNIEAKINIPVKKLSLAGIFSYGKQVGDDLQKSINLSSFVVSGLALRSFDD